MIYIVSIQTRPKSLGIVLTAMLLFLSLSGKKYKSIIIFELRLGQNWQQFLECEVKVRNGDLILLGLKAYEKFVPPPEDNDKMVTRI